MGTRLRGPATVLLMTGLLSIGPSYQSAAITITPTVDGTVRDGHGPKDGHADEILEWSIVQALDVDRFHFPFEDRGIIEFDIAALPGAPSRVTLNLPVFNSVGPFPFTIDVFSYVGDGSLSLADFGAGSLLTSFDHYDSTSVGLDVTRLILDMQASSNRYVGFNFQFAVPSTVVMNGPFIAFNSLEYPPPATLTSTVPEPGPLALWLSALAGVLARHSYPRLNRTTRRHGRNAILPSGTPE